ncbi:MAG: vitamin K epoxide reductase family protein, partial [Spirochaetes bacterium]|nr:vitamin K epoxide reductase family protein [Spirochaetota bacterium]
MNNKKILLAMIITCFVAVIVSLYLLYVHYFPLVPDATLYSLCTAGTMFDCNAVNTSAYAVLFGMPLSAWGVAFYLFFIAVILLSIIFYKKIKTITLSEIKGGVIVGVFLFTAFA